MPGIFGLVDERAAPDELQSLVARMARSLQFKDYQIAETAVVAPTALGRMSLGLVNTFPQPQMSDCGKVQAFFEGELYETETIVARLPATTPPPRDDAALILQLYLHCGEKFLSLLHGTFTLAIWDSRHARLLLAADRFGMWPLFFAEQDGRLLFAPEVKAILACPGFRRNINAQAIADFFTFGNLVGDETLFHGVQHLPPGHWLIWEAGRVRVQPFWELEVSDEFTLERKPDIVERLAELMRQAVKRRLDAHQRRPVGFLLSGGTDSRAVVAAADRATFSHPTFVFGTPAQLDMRVAQRLADRLGNPHHPIELAPDYLQHWAECGVALTDGMMLCNTMAVLPPMDRVRQHISVLFTGDCGDWVLGGEAGLGRCYAGLTDEAATQRYFNSYYHGGSLLSIAEQPGFFTDTFRREIQTPGLSRLRHFVSQLKSQGSNNRLWHFSFRHEALRTSRYGVALLRSHVLPLLPFFDNDLVDYAVRVPPSMRYRRQMEVRVIRRLAPDLARVTWQYTGLPMDWPMWAYYGSRIAFRLHERVSRGTRQAIPLPLDRSVTPMEQWMRTSLRPWIEDLLLSKRALGRGYFREAAVRTLVSDYMHMRRKVSYDTIGVLITLELWSRLFVDGDGLHETC